MIGVFEGGTTLKQQSVGRYVAPHYSDSDSTSLSSNVHDDMKYTNNKPGR
jgi:hypothetical protein